jgi:hypothetical protein
MGNFTDPSGTTKAGEWKEGQMIRWM